MRGARGGGKSAKKPPRPETGRWVMKGYASLCNVQTNTPSGYQRPVGHFGSTTVKQNPSVSRLPRAKPGTPSGYQRPVGHFGSTTVKQNPSGTSLSAATRRKKSPVSGETGDFHYNLFDTIRRADTSDRSGGFTRLPSSTTYQARKAQCRTTRVLLDYRLAECRTACQRRLAA